MALKLQAEVGVDGSGFASGIEKLQGTAEKFTESLKGFVVGAVGIYSLEQAIDKTVETAKELVETSERLSIAPEQLQVLREAARQSGKELGDLATAFEKVNIARAKALRPGIEGHDLRVRFGQAGINDQQLRSMTAAQLFMGPLAQLARSGSAEQVGPILRDILGKGFGELMPVLKTDFGELENKLKSVGAIMDTETAVKLKNLSEEFGLVSKIIASQLGPALISLVEVVYTLILKLGRSVAGGAAFAGAATAKMSGRELTAFILANLTGNTKVMTELAPKLDFKAGKVAMGEAEAPWQAKLDQFTKLLAKWAEEADKLDKPPIPAFGTSQEKVSKRAFETPSDSLTKIGNFLGGFGVEQRKVDLLARIEVNTRNKGVRGGWDAGSLPKVDFNSHNNEIGFPGAVG